MRRLPAGSRASGGWRARLTSGFGVSERDADILVAEPALADYFEAVARIEQRTGKATANWVTGEAACGASGRSEERVSRSARTFPVRPPGRLAEVIRLVGSGRVSHTAAKTDLRERLAATAGAESAEETSPRSSGLVPGE